MKRSIETRSFPNLLVATPRDLTFYVADPISSIRAPVTTGNRYRAELEHGIVDGNDCVTFQMRQRRYFQIPTGSIFRKGTKL